MTSTTHRAAGRSRGFRHEAVLYRGLDHLTELVLPFVREGLALGERVLVAMPEDRLRRIRAELGADARQVTFVDMRELGGNPARLVPEWRRFLDDADGRPVRGVGEPVWAGRREEEISECVLHEALLNVAFEDGPEWHLLCPYDADALPRELVDEVFRTHPQVVDGDRKVPYQGRHVANAAFGEPLPAPSAEVDTVPFMTEDLDGVRDVVRHLAERSGVGPDAADDLVLATHEVAANSIRHGGGSGRLSVWTQPDAFVVEVRDSGRIRDPMVGRELADPGAENGRGVWMAHQLCDLVQVRSSRAGTVVRLYSWL